MAYCSSEVTPVAVQGRRQMPPKGRAPDAQPAYGCRPRPAQSGSSSRLGPTAHSAFEATGCQSSDALSGEDDAAAARPQNPPSPQATAMSVLNFRRRQRALIGGRAQAVGRVASRRSR